MITVAFTIPGDAVAFARAGAKGAVRFTPKKQRDFMAVVKDFAAEAMAGRPPIEGAVELCLDAIYIVPRSWSAKKSAAAKWKTSKPDVDNIAKIVKDAVKSIVWLDDAQVAKLTATKRYGALAEMRVTISPLS